MARVTSRVTRIVGHGWYWANGEGVDSAVPSAVEEYNDRGGEPANFVQLCDEDLGELTLNGRLGGVRVFRRNGDRGNIMVGRIE